MTEPSDLLSALTANPQMLKDAMQMASALASSGMLNGLFQKESPAEPKETAEPQKGSGDFASLLSGLFAGQSGGDAQTNPQAERSTDKASDRGGAVDRTHKNRPCHNDRIQLLRALRPFLPEEKRDKIDFLIQLLGLLNAAEQLGVGKLF